MVDHVGLQKPQPHYRSLHSRILPLILQYIVDLDVEIFLLLLSGFFTFHTPLNSLSFAKELPKKQKSLLTFPPCRQLCILALGQKFKERCFNTSQALQASSTAFFNHRWHVLTMSVGLTILYQLRFCSSLVVRKTESHRNTWNLVCGHRVIVCLFWHPY